MTSWHSYRMMINIGQMLEQKGIEYLFSFNSNRFTTILLHAKREVLFLCFIQLPNLNKKRQVYIIEMYIAKNLDYCIRENMRKTRFFEKKSPLGYNILPSS